MNRYIAEVKDNNDPDKEGKVQIYVAFLHHDMKTDLLPWAKMDRGVTSDIPEKGDLVWVWFSDMTYYKKPFYMNKVNLKELHDHNETIGSMESEYPDVKYIKLKNDVAIGISSSDDKPEISVVHPTGTEIYIDKLGTVEIKLASGQKLITKGINGAPTGNGGFCGLKQCLFTGGNHTTEEIIGG